ncbi:pantothenate synthetase [Capsulimonas corticalis]|uniref:Pantothenate synthetase n=1 Tax=Capsulimonas corticalis TaxID=2219043 RepID=A0A402D4X7_9BACT|nr:pantoate--beta-alanine ligase [Capsulimonas corticalis]BDI29237.1 pantothenate synthetase [Capsulimonas corticalis]
METITTIAALRQALRQARREDQTIGLVPTMGAFHEGHLTLMRRAKAENDIVVATLFVNPAQFNDPEDFEKYPRDDERDAALAAAEGVDYLFTPAPAEVYPKEFDTVVVVRALSERLEGASRPGHFNGVSTVVAKLLNIAGADRAYFGEKDWQQLQLVKRMAADLDIPTEIVSVPTVREPDGLALSSRNVRLTPDQRKAAKVLSSALSDTQAIADTGVQDAYQLAAWLRQTIEVQPGAKIDYAVVVDPETLQEIDTIENGALAAVAATFGKVRLIDNRLLNPPIGPGLRR